MTTTTEAGPGPDAWYLAHPERAVAELRALQRAIVAALVALDALSGCDEKETADYAAAARDALRDATEAARPAWEMTR